MIHHYHMTLQHATGSLTSPLDPAWLVRDQANETLSHLELDALVRSGDYCAELATRLDAIKQTLPPDEAHRVERIVSELLYVQAHYSLSRRVR